MKRILVVEDQEANQYLLRALFAGNGFAVELAAHGAEALAKARQHPPDLIIADILMPVMDGFSLCREWKQDDRLKLIPFIFYTATYTDDRDRELALSLAAPNGSSLNPRSRKHSWRSSGNSPGKKFRQRRSPRRRSPRRCASRWKRLPSRKPFTSNNTTRRSSASWKTKWSSWKKPIARWHRISPTASERRTNCASPK